MESGLRQVLFYPAEGVCGNAGFDSQLRAKVMLFPPGSRLAETSRAEDTGLAPKESAIDTLCRWAVMASSAKGFVFLAPFLLEPPIPATYSSGYAAGNSGQYAANYLGGMYHGGSVSGL